MMDQPSYYRPIKPGRGRGQLDNFRRSGGGGANYRFTINNNHHHHHQHNQSSSTSNTSSCLTAVPSVAPAVKILAKTSQKPAESTTTTTTTIITSCNNNNNNSTSTSECKEPNAKRPEVIVIKPEPLKRPTPSATTIARLDRHIRSGKQPAPGPVEKRSETQGGVVREVAKCYKLLDAEFNLPDNPLIESALLADGPLSSIATTTTATSGSGSTSATTTVAPGGQVGGGQSFCIVAAVGLDGSGKSTLLNHIANCDVFRTHRAAGLDSDNPLGHVTTGIDLHITPERVFLLDTQPLLSASILHSMLTTNSTPEAASSSQSSSSKSSGQSWHNKSYYSQRNDKYCSVVGFDIAEPENFAFIYSLQLLTFLLTVCDHLVVVIDSFSLDAYLFKLLATAVMMTGDSASVTKANIIVYLKQQQQQQRAKCATKGGSEQLFRDALRTLLGPNVTVELIIDDCCTLTTMVVKPPSRNLITDQPQTINYSSERSWYHSIHRFWDGSIRKTTLFSDYARCLP